LPGSYTQNLPFAPGIRSAAIEPEFLAKKHFGWPGFGAYGDVLYRWNRTTGNDQGIFSFGFFQQIKGWELDAGYRHLQTVNGTDLGYDPGTQTLSTSDGSNAFSGLREINDSIEAGFSYTTPKRHIKFSLYTRNSGLGAALKCPSRFLSVIEPGSPGPLPRVKFACPPPADLFHCNP
jgi:hypothetical protein